MRIGIYLGLPIWGGGGGSAPPDPPVEFDFQEFDMTAGGEGQWVGYSVGTSPAPQPAFGSISNQPTATTTLLAFYDDTASGVFLAAFAGDYVDELDGVQISIGGFVVDSFEVELISGTTWVRFTGITGDLTVGSSYEVLFGWDLTPAQELWTPDDLPAMYKTNGGMWDAANSQIAGTNQVSAVTDSWGVRDMRQANSANQPFSGTRNGFSAVVWPDTTGSRWVGVTAAFQPKYYVEVSQFQTGVEATADAGITHIIGGDSDALTSRVRIRQGASGFTNPADGDFVAAKNGATAFSVNVLPLPMSIMEITGSFGSTPWGAGRSSIVLRSWRGPKLWWMFLGEVPTLDLRQRIQGWLAWRYNLVASLPADHPYKNAAPTKEFMVEQQGNNFTIQSLPSENEFDVNQSGNEFAFTGA